MSCPDCFIGHEHTETPTGTVKAIHGLPTYVAMPEGTPKGLVVVISDAFGWDFVNIRVLCDTYAKKGGFIVYCHAMSFSSVRPLMKGIMEPAPWLQTLIYKPLYFAQALYHAVPWFITTRPAIVKPRIFAFFKALRTSPPPFPTPNLKIGAAGFCWGGQHVFALCADTPSSRVHRHESQASCARIEPLVECGFTAHPSMVNVPADPEDVSLPISVTVGDEDMAMKGHLIREMGEILMVKKKGDHEVVILKNAKHGFAVREDKSDPYQLECAEKAEKQAMEWFGKWLS